MARALDVWIWLDAVAWLLLGQWLIDCLDRSLQFAVHEHLNEAAEFPTVLARVWKREVALCGSRDLIRAVKLNPFQETLKRFALV